MTHSLAKKMRKPAAMRVLAYRWHNYVGSVLFFKHLILLTVLVLIITPWFFVADLTQKSNAAQGDAKRLEQTVAELKTELAEKTHALEAAEAAPAASLHVSAAGITGDVNVSDTVILSSGTNVIGNVAAGDLLCSGSIKGDVTVGNNFALDANAVVEGNITTATMTMAQGAVIGGTVTMKGKK
jgi:cytoskeletal protein CcmA (bactofilin family)